MKPPPYRTIKAARAAINYPCSICLPGVLDALLDPKIQAWLSYASRARRGCIAIHQHRHAANPHYILWQVVTAYNVREGLTLSDWVMGDKLYAVLDKTVRIYQDRPVVEPRAWVPPAIHAAPAAEQSTKETPPFVLEEMEENI